MYESVESMLAPDKDCSRSHALHRREKGARLRPIIGYQKKTYSTHAVPILIHVENRFFEVGSARVAFPWATLKAASVGGLGYYGALLRH